ncbi:xanthine dehydrogenase subunit XdhC [Sebaldella sp. S0638]|uniref:xanthine dehydrogenase subunit XdhC n=1 Tax=Sebaldella sp. S0638 TaxID=2957809 RepID=UPI0020A06ACE|nr:xanthine dehydrogenase subunit XdhC [Sebaldella sp. S0638]MCP1225110.1 (2Fe-2S)-binding protein [Sebaldella sp. S0638]
MVKNITFTVNGKEYNINVDVRKSLLEVLREELNFTGTKQGCAVGECGACTVIIDGVTADSCIYLAVWADGKTIKTIEGVSDRGGNLSDIQESYIDAGAVQCGFCTPGLILSTEVLLDNKPEPTRDEIRRGISGNLCRCTGYQKIIDAVEKTVEKRKG